MDIDEVFDLFAKNYAGEIDEQVMSRDSFKAAIEFMEVSSKLQKALDK